MWVSAGAAIAVWLVLATIIRQFQWTLLSGVIANVVTFAICVPLLRPYMHVATRVATVVSTSSWVGPRVSGVIALFPIVFTSLMLVLHPRIGGKPTAAAISNGAWGLMGFGLAIAVLHVVVLRFGSAIGLSLALATCIGWNLALWWNGRRKAARSQ